MILFGGTAPYIFFTSKTGNAARHSPFICLSDIYQYARPQYSIFLAGLPQHTHTSDTCSCSKGMHLLVTAICSLILSSHSLLPHHIALTNPDLLSNIPRNSSILCAV